MVYCKTARVCYTEGEVEKKLLACKIWNVMPRSFAVYIEGIQRGIVRAAQCLFYRCVPLSAGVGTHR